MSRVSKIHLRHFTSRISLDLRRNNSPAAGLTVRNDGGISIENTNIFFIFFLSYFVIFGIHTLSKYFVYHFEVDLSDISNNTMINKMLVLPFDVPLSFLSHF